MSTPQRWFGAITAEVMLDPSIHPTAKAVYGILAVHADKTGACYVANTRIAIALGCSRNTVVQHINALVEAGVVERQARFVEGVQRSNTYVLLDLTSGRKKRRKKRQG